MCRKEFLNDISQELNSIGFVQSSEIEPFTYQRNVKYPSLFTDKSDYAHFVVNTPQGIVQIVAKYQQTAGTAIDKLGYTAFDAARTDHDAYLVVCGGDELLKSNRAITFLNSQRHLAPKLLALRVDQLSSYFLNKITQ